MTHNTSQRRPNKVKCTHTLCLKRRIPPNYQW